MAMPVCISTALNVARLCPALIDPDGNWGEPPTNLLDFIVEGDGEIRSALRELYGTDLTVSSWAGAPYYVQDANAGSGELLSAAAGTSAISEMWTITFASSSAFSVKGTHSKSQGSGTTGGTFTATNGNLVIATTDWTGTPDTGDVFYVCTYNYEATLVRLSSLIAAAMYIDSVYSEQVNSDSTVGKRRREEADRILKRLLDPTSEFTLEVGRSVINTSPISLDGGFEDISYLGKFNHTVADEETADH